MTLYIFKGWLKLNVRMHGETAEKCCKDTAIVTQSYPKSIRHAIENRNVSLLSKIVDEGCRDFILVRG